MANETEQAKAYELFMSKLQEQADAKAREMIKPYFEFVKGVSSSFGDDMKKFQKITRKLTTEVKKLSKTVAELDKALQQEIRKQKKKPKTDYVA